MKKNVCINLDTQELKYEDYSASPYSALACVNAWLNNAMSYALQNAITSAEDCINKVWEWLDKPTVNVSTAAEAYIEISKIYAQIDDYMELPEPCPFINA